MMRGTNRAQSRRALPNDANLFEQYTPRTDSNAWDARLVVNINNHRKHGWNVTYCHESIGHWRWPCSAAGVALKRNKTCTRGSWVLLCAATHREGSTKMPHVCAMVQRNGEPNWRTKARSLVNWLRHRDVRPGLNLSASQGGQFIAREYNGLPIPLLDLTFCPVPIFWVKRNNL